MYRINAITSGKYRNVKTGHRYCLTKRAAKELLNIFSESDCEVTLEKFVHIHGTIFCWSDYEEDKIFNYYYNLFSKAD